MHGNGGSGGGFAVEVAGGGEVVKGGFEGDFVVESVGHLVWFRIKILRKTGGERLLFVVLSGFVDESVHFVVEELVPKFVGFASSEILIIKNLFTPFF